MKVLLSLILIIISLNKVFTQDTLIKLDNTQIVVKVEEIDDNIVKYRRYNYIDGPLYKLPKNEILKIILKSGDVEVFNSDKQIKSFSSFENHSNYENQLTIDIKGNYKFVLSPLDIKTFHFIIDFNDILNNSSFAGIKWLRFNKRKFKKSSILFVYYTNI